VIPPKRISVNLTISQITAGSNLLKYMSCFNRLNCSNWFILLLAVTFFDIDYCRTASLYLFHTLGKRSFFGYDHGTLVISFRLPQNVENTTLNNKELILFPLSQLQTEHSHFCFVILCDHVLCVCWFCTVTFPLPVSVRKFISHISQIVKDPCFIVIIICACNFV
jgi:hypothetical protein